MKFACSSRSFKLITFDGSKLSYILTFTLTFSFLLNKKEIPKRRNTGTLLCYWRKTCTTVLYSYVYIKRAGRRDLQLKIFNLERVSCMNVHGKNFPTQMLWNEVDDWNEVWNWELENEIPFNSFWLQKRIFFLNHHVTLSLSLSLTKFNAIQVRQDHRWCCFLGYFISTIDLFSTAIMARDPSRSLRRT